jgi:hypothetical protein
MKPDPIEEVQTISVSVKLGATFVKALDRWAKARFGRATSNRGAMLRVLIEDRLKAEAVQEPRS